VKNDKRRIRGMMGFLEKKKIGLLSGEGLIISEWGKGERLSVLLRLR
jgi:hypothetical protein